MEETKMSVADEEKEKIKAAYAGIVANRVKVKPFEKGPYFEIMYFDCKDKRWHIGYGSFCFDYVEKWLKEEFEPTYKRLECAIEDLTSKAEKVERERNEYFNHLKGLCFCCAHRTDGFDCHAKCFGHKRGSAWVYAGPRKEE
jgi:hypothetical protein